MARKTNLDHVEDTIFLLDYLGIYGAERYVYGIRFKKKDYSIRIIASKRAVTRGIERICLSVSGHTNHASPYPREIAADYMPPSMEILMRDLVINRSLLETQS